METNGILPGRTKEKATLRGHPVEPYSAEFVPARIGACAAIAEVVGRLGLNLFLAG